MRKRRRKPASLLRPTWVTEVLRSLTDAQVEALMRVAKTRGRAFFSDPYRMIELRTEYEARRKQA